MLFENEQLYNEKDFKEVTWGQVDPNSSLAKMLGASAHVNVNEQIVEQSTSASSSQTPVQAGSRATMLFLKGFIIKQKGFGLF